jgi:hypothetical protein
VIEGENNCRTCRGLLTFSSGQTFIETVLLEQAEASGASLGGIRLSREKLRQFLELPPPDQIQAFDAALTTVRTDETYYRSHAAGFIQFDAKTGLFSVDEAKVEAEASQQDLYLSGRTEDLYDRLEKLAADATQLNRELAQIKHGWDNALGVIEIQGAGLVTEVGGFEPPRVKVDQRWVRERLAKTK